MCSVKCYLNLLNVFFVCVTDNFTDAAVSGRINGEHKEKDLEPWDGGETHNSDSLESLDTDVVREHTEGVETGLLSTENGLLYQLF